MIPVKMVDVVLRELELDDEQTRKQYQLVIMNEAQRRAFVIWIGEYEGLTIASKLSSYETPRPMTYTFISRLIQASGARLEKVEISELKDEVFYATVYLNTNGILSQVDARPSDAIALAIYTDTPLFASEQIMAEQGFDIPEKHIPTQKGIAEIQEVMAATEKVVTEHWERLKNKPETQQQSELADEAQFIISKVFEETTG